MADVEITLRASADRATRSEQIQSIIDAAYVEGKPVRVRIPVTMYRPGKQSAAELRDAAWNFSFPSGTTTEQIEAMILTVGKCLEAIAREGSAVVLQKLESVAPHV